ALALLFVPHILARLVLSDSAGRRPRKPAGRARKLTRRRGAMPPSHDRRVGAAQSPLAAIVVAGSPRSTAGSAGADRVLRRATCWTHVCPHETDRRVGAAEDAWASSRFAAPPHFRRGSWEPARKCGAPVALFRLRAPPLCSSLANLRLPHLFRLAIAPGGRGC